ncbi:MAG: antibiotic biosynthesis monooxygenase family protein [Candidatus Nanopelagicaceae bacterium]
MESLALVVTVILFTSMVGGPTALILTYVPSKPRWVRIMRTLLVLVLTAVSLLFGIQLVIGDALPLVPRLIGISAVATSVLALLYEFKVLKHKVKASDGSSIDSEIDSEIHSEIGSKTYAVIFTSKRQDANSELYYQHNDLLVEQIKTIPGYIRHQSVRHPETREGITIAYFNSLEAIDQWRKDEQHIEAKSMAQSHFYEDYNLEITEVQDRYGWAGN